MLTLDHVFVFVDREQVAPDGFVTAALRSAGLVPSYRRRHDGQGTENVCYCFDNAFLELLFVADAAEIAAPALARTGLAARSQWRQNGASPFGLALRGDGALPFASFDYRFAGLPPGLSIPVAEESSDPGQPFLFRSPGNARPDQWTDGRAGVRQEAAGLTEIVSLRLETPAPVGPALAAVAAAGIVTVRPGSAHRLVITMAEATGGMRRLALPGALWLGSADD